MESRTALVLGATGGIGGELARRLQRTGWAVRALHREADAMAGVDGLDWRRGDALIAEDVTAAAQGVDLIVHAVNPPGYKDWGKLVLPMLENTIAAARSTGARVVLPGTVYNYGPDALPTPDETSPQNPATRKGRIRVAMEQRLRKEAEAGRARSLIVRAGDFFGPRAANNWFSQGLVKPGRRPTSISYPGKPDIGHQWAYLPDVAETMARLVECGSLDDFATFHMEGHWDADGTKMVDAIRWALNAPALPVRRFPWLVVCLGQPFYPLFRELAEMKYLWDTPLRMGNERLLALLGSEPHTPLDTAVATTLKGLQANGRA
jgi:nucleoside-diphosphate-sugar epimerase